MRGYLGGWANPGCGPAKRRLWTVRIQKPVTPREERECERLQRRYIVRVTSALRDVEIWAADNGLTLPPPPFQTFPEWLADQQVKATARNPPDEN